MTKETRTFHIDGYDYSFNFSAFKHLFNTYRVSMQANVSEAEGTLAELLNISPDTVHSWRNEKSGPSDLSKIKDLGDALGMNDYMALLTRKIEVQDMTKDDRILDSLKRIYDAAIIYLDDFETSAGFCEYYKIIEDEYYYDDSRPLVSRLFELASDKLHEVEIVLMQEYIILHSLDIYTKLENYVYGDLCNLWDGKPEEPGLESCDFSDKAASDRVISAAKEATKARNNLNEIMSEFF